VRFLRDDPTNNQNKSANILLELIRKNLFHFPNATLKYLPKTRAAKEIRISAKTRIISAARKK
jgi:hypothetical protein